MPISLVGQPTLKVTYSDPNIAADSIGVQSAEWDGRANVKVENEHTKKYRIGFVQLLEKNVMQAIYENNTRSEVLIPPATMPVLDSDDNPDYRPFYDDDTAAMEYRPKDVQTDAGTPSKEVAIRMWDEPESPYPWYLNNDVNNPLREFVMSLTFSTYIVARDITGGGGLMDPYDLTILKQWGVVLDRRYTFNVVQGATVGGQLQADTVRTKVEIANPQRQPYIVGSTRGFPNNAVAIFRGSVANDVFTDHDTGKNEKRVGSLIASRVAQFGG